MSTKTAPGNVLQFAPDATGGYHVRFKFHQGGKKVEEWVEPLIGWAVMQGCPLDDEADGYETSIEPVVLAEGFPTNVRDYLLDRDGLTTYRVELRDPWGSPS